MTWRSMAFNKCRSLFVCFYLLLYNIIEGILFCYNIFWLTLKKHFIFCCNLVLDVMHFDLDHEYQLKIMKSLSISAKPIASIKVGFVVWLITHLLQAWASLVVGLNESWFANRTIYRSQATNSNQSESSKINSIYINKQNGKIKCKSQSVVIPSH